MSYGVENRNDFSDRVGKRKNHSLLDIGIRDHRSHVHVVKHGLIGCEQDSDGSDVGVPILVLSDPRERAIPQ